MIKVENVTKKYGNHVAVNNMSFEIEDGEIVGFLGPNGAGKTTTMNMITGVIESTSGKIEIDGYDISRKPRKAKKEIGYMPETTPLYTELTPKEFVTYMAELKGVPKKKKKEEVQNTLKDVGIEEVQNKLIRNLSRGYKQRVSLAGALVGHPKVLILDEPTVGLDPKQVIQIRKLIKSLGKNHTVILSSHILSEVSQVCEKVIIINKGNLVTIDTPENLEKNAKEEKGVLVTVEDSGDKIEDISKEIEDIKSIELIKELPDKTKQYKIISKDGKDIRKEIFAAFAKLEITILELKTMETTLEDAFVDIIDSEPVETENKEPKAENKNENNKKVKEQKAQKTNKKAKNKKKGGKK